MDRHLFLSVRIGGVFGLGGMFSMSGPRAFFMIGPLTVEIGLEKN